MPPPEIPAAALAPGCCSTNVSVCPGGTSWRTRPCQPELPAGLPACALAAKPSPFAARRFKSKQQQRDAHRDPSMAWPDASHKALGRLQRSRTLTHRKLVTFSKKSL